MRGLDLACGDALRCAYVTLSNGANGSVSGVAVEANENPVDVNREGAIRNQTTGYRKPSIGFKDRMEQARGNLARLLGVPSASQRLLGDLLAEYLGQRRPVSQTTVAGWEQKPPDIDTIAAIADVCGVHRSWLAFTEGPTEKAPDGHGHVGIPIRPPPDVTAREWLAERSLKAKRKR